MDEEVDKPKKDNTSSKATIEAGKDAIKAAQITAPTDAEKSEDGQKKDAEKWRNEG